MEPTEKAQEVLGTKVFQPIGVSDPLPSGRVSGSNGCSEIILDPLESQPNKETKEGRVLFYFVLFSAEHQ